MSGDKASRLYIAVATDDRLAPVISEGLKTCAEQTAKAFDLEYSAIDIDNWEDVSELSSTNGHYRFMTHAHDWKHVSIHELTGQEALKDMLEEDA